MDDLVPVPLVFPAFCNHFLRPGGVLAHLHCQGKFLEHIGLVGISARPAGLAALLLGTILEHVTEEDVAVVQHLAHFLGKPPGNPGIFPS